MFSDPNFTVGKLKENPRLALWWLYAQLTASQRSLPNFMIAGTARGGTTSLFQYLSEHPNIFPPLRKEIKYFDCNYFMGHHWYQSHFPMRAKLANSRGITGEATPNYLGHPTAMQRIALALPNVKLIFILRNPVDRAYSHYHLSVKAGQENLSFEDAIAQEPTRLAGEAEKIAADYTYSQSSFITHSYLTRGQYVDQISTVLKLFPLQNILILRSEDFYADPGSIYRQILQFLEMPAWEPPRYQVLKSSSYQSPMPQETRQKLVDYFRPYNQRLSDLLGRDFDWDK